MLAAELLGGLLDHLASGSLTALTMRRNLASLWYAVKAHQVPNAIERGKAVASFRRYAVAVELGRADLAVTPVAELRDLGVIVMVQEPKQPAGPLGRLRSPFVKPHDLHGAAGPRMGSQGSAPSRNARIARIAKAITREDRAHSAPSAVPIGSNERTPQRLAASRGSRNLHGRSGLKPVEASPVPTPESEWSRGR